MKIDSYKRIPEKMALIYEQLACCQICPHRCRVNRLAGQIGVCSLDAKAYCFREMLSLTEEAPLNPSHQVYFAGCNLRCGFCSVAEWNLRPMEVPTLTEDTLTGTIIARRQQGATNVNLLGGEPAVSIYGILAILGRILPENIVVWNSNMYFGGPVRSALKGLVNIYLADFKCGNNRCAERMLGVSDYLEVIQPNMIWASGQSALIVRHVILPGHIECCAVPILEWIACHLPGVGVSLRYDYTPPVPSGRCPSTYLSKKDVQKTLKIAQHLQLKVI